MAALGWLLNLDFAASNGTAPTVAPSPKSSLILIGVCLPCLIFFLF